MLSRGSLAGHSCAVAEAAEACADAPAPEPGRVLATVVGGAQGARLFQHALACAGAGHTVWLLTTREAAPPREQAAAAAPACRAPNAAAHVHIRYVKSELDLRFVLASAHVLDPRPSVLLVDGVEALHGSREALGATLALVEDGARAIGAAAAVGLERAVPGAERWFGGAVDCV